MRSPVLAAAVSLGFASAAWAQTPAGGAFPVNTTTASEQKRPQPAVGPRGDFLIAWNSLNQDGSNFGVFARRYDAFGNALGGEFQVNTTTALAQYTTDAAADAGGNYIVVWHSSQQDGSNKGVVGRVFASSGAALTGEFAVNAFVAGNQQYPAVAPQPGGGFVVVWESAGEDGSSYAVVGRRFDARGNPLTGDFLVNTFTPNGQRHPAVSSDAAGNFVVVWHSDGQDGNLLGVFGRRFNAAGAPLSGEFQVNTGTLLDQRYPDVSTLADGRFVITWESYNGDGARFGIMGRRYDAAGTPLTGEYQINVYTTDHQRSSSVAAYGNGASLTSWFSTDQLGPLNNDTFARQFDAAGSPGPEFLLNPFTPGNQFQARLDSDEVGNIVATWDSVGQDGSLDGVYARRFGGLVPFDLNVDSAGPSSNGNRVFEAGETVYVQPWWRNVNGATLAFDGFGSGFTGPFGPAYTFIDNTANYGPVPNGAAGPACFGGAAGCFAMSISAGTRPAAHWDAQFREDITPPSLGMSKVWVLHIGDTFSDMPRSNPFYRFVETVLHLGVIPGCTSSTYCPFGAVTRAQMAEFVLRSKDPNFVPPACVAGGEMFADVPAASLSCRWVEELARRGVVAGCGGGNYCPTLGVSREQLAVFLLVTLEGLGYTPPACGTPVFNDVPASSPFCRFVEELSRRGVVAGCGGGAYCPALGVARDQMSVFLTVTFSLALYGP